MAFGEFLKIMIIILFGVNYSIPENYDNSLELGLILLLNKPQMVFWMPAGHYRYRPSSI